MIIIEVGIFFLHEGILAEGGSPSSLLSALVGLGSSPQGIARFRRNKISESSR
jgi:hypothetical protein